MHDVTSLSRGLLIQRQAAGPCRQAEAVTPCLQVSVLAAPVPGEDAEDEFDDVADEESQAQAPGVDGAGAAAEEGDADAEDDEDFSMDSAAENENEEVMNGPVEAEAEPGAEPEVGAEPASPVDNGGESVVDVLRNLDMLEPHVRENAKDPTLVVGVVSSGGCASELPQDPKVEVCASGTMRCYPPADGC
jgi:hypothetical protein